MLYNVWLSHVSLYPQKMIGGCLEDGLKPPTIHDIWCDRRRWAGLKSMEGKGIISLIGGQGSSGMSPLEDRESRNVRFISLCFTARKPIFPFSFWGSPILVQQYPNFRRNNSFVLTDRGYKSIKSPGEKNIDADLLPVDEYTVLYSHDCPGTLSKSMFEKARFTTFLI